MIWPWEHSLGVALAGLLILGGLALLASVIAVLVFLVCGRWHWTKIYSAVAVTYFVLGLLGGCLLLVWALAA